MKIIGFFPTLKFGENNFPGLETLEKWLSVLVLDKIILQQSSIRIIGNWTCQNQARLIEDLQ
jgi:hypothetical protein